MEVLKARAAEVQEAMDAALESANSEEKSSAGDKYETGRAMGMIDRERLNSQLQQILKDASFLKRINTDKDPDKPGPGTLIQEGDKWIFISIGLGKQRVMEKEVWFISPSAPLAAKYIKS